MENSAKDIRKKHLIKTIKQFFKKEWQPLFTYAAMVAGAAAFYLVIDRNMSIPSIDMKWLIIFIPLINLPKVFVKLKSYNQHQPYTIIFAKAFKEGFLSLPRFAPDLSKFGTILRRLSKNLKK